MASNASRDAHEQWALETKLIEDQLARIERAEHAILKEVGCPIDPAAIYAILAGEKPAPWPKRTAARDKQRALHAMHTLLAVQKTRRYLDPLHENPRLAAEAALMAGALAGDLLINAALGATSRRTNRTSGQKRWAHLKTRDARIWQAAARYKAAHPGASTRDVAVKVTTALKLRETPETIRGRLRLLGRRIKAASLAGKTTPG
jgi:hypothetical protein